MKFKDASLAYLALFIDCCSFFLIHLEIAIKQSKFTIFPILCSIRAPRTKENIETQIFFFLNYWEGFVNEKQMCKYSMRLICIDFLAQKGPKRPKNAENAHSGPGSGPKYLSETIFDHKFGFPDPKLV